MSWPLDHCIYCPPRSRAKDRRCGFFAGPPPRWEPFWLHACAKHAAPEGVALLRWAREFGGALAPRGIDTIRVARGVHAGHLYIDEVLQLDADATPEDVARCKVPGTKWRLVAAGGRKRVADPIVYRSYGLTGKQAVSLDRRFAVGIHGAVGPALRREDWVPVPVSDLRAFLPTQGDRALQSRIVELLQASERRLSAQGDPEDRS